MAPVAVAQAGILRADLEGTLGFRSGDQVEGSLVVFVQRIKRGRLAVRLPLKGNTHVQHGATAFESVGVHAGRRRDVARGEGSDIGVGLDLKGIMDNAEVTGRSA